MTEFKKPRLCKTEDEMGINQMENLGRIISEETSSDKSA